MPFHVSEILSQLMQHLTNPECCYKGLFFLLTFDFIHLISLFSPPQFHFNPAQSILVMEGEDLENMNSAVRKVSYINSRQFPTPGIRRLHISTAVQYVKLFFISYSSHSLSLSCLFHTFVSLNQLPLSPSLCIASVRYNMTFCELLRSHGRSHSLLIH